ncbi:MAG: hypothetical protein R3D58_01200 [Saprospiraceae bacterium]
MQKKSARHIALGACIGLVISLVPSISVTRFYSEDWTSTSTSVSILPGNLAVGLFLGALAGWIVGRKKF